MDRDKKLLYRKVNTTAFNVHHLYGLPARDDRNTKEGISRRMVQGKRRGLDYTPLYKYLLSKVGKLWEDVSKDALKRLDNSEALWHIVAKPNEWPKRVCRSDENSYCSGLFIDEAGLLQIVDPTINIDDLYPHCKCCTHTFNGIPYTNKYDPEKDPRRNGAK
jgi:hypothetical protein